MGELYLDNIDRLLLEERQQEESRRAGNTGEAERKDDLTGRSSPRPLRRPPGAYDEDDRRESLLSGVR